MSGRISSGDGRPRVPRRAGGGRLGKPAPSPSSRLRRSRPGGRANGDAEGTHNIGRGVRVESSSSARAPSVFVNARRAARSVLAVIRSITTSASLPPSSSPSPSPLLSSSSSDRCNEGPRQPTRRRAPVRRGMSSQTGGSCRPRGPPPAVAAFVPLPCYDTGDASRGSARTGCSAGSWSRPTPRRLDRHPRRRGSAVLSDPPSLPGVEPSRTQSRSAVKNDSWSSLPVVERHAVQLKRPSWSLRPFDFGGELAPLPPPDLDSETVSFSPSPPSAAFPAQLFSAYLSMVPSVVSSLAVPTTSPSPCLRRSNRRRSRRPAPRLP